MNRIRAFIQQAANYLYRLGQADIERRRQRRVRSIGARRIVIPLLALVIFIALMLAI